MFKILERYLILSHGDPSNEETRIYYIENMMENTNSHISIYIQSLSFKNIRKSDIDYGYISVLFPCLQYFVVGIYHFYEQKGNLYCFKPFTN